MKLGIKNLGIDGTLIAKTWLTTIRMSFAENGKIRVWENGNFIGQFSKKDAQEMLDKKDFTEIYIQ